MKKGKDTVECNVECNVPMREKQIPREMEDIDNNLSDLDSIANELISLISVVLRAEGEELTKEDKNKTPRETLVYQADMLRGFNDRIKSTRSCVSSAINRLEL